MFANVQLLSIPGSSGSYSCTMLVQTVGDGRQLLLTYPVGEGGGHVRIAKVQHTLAKAVHALGCVYSVIIMSNYSRFIMPVKKLQFPP